MPGPVALVGAGEFLPTMSEFDASLLAATGRTRPRVAILPTASYPDGELVFQRWAAMGVSHFAALGAEVEPVLVRDRAAADDPVASQAIGEATGVALAPYGALALAAWRGDEALAAPLIEASLADVVARGEDTGVLVAHWAQSVLLNGLGRYQG